jgi:hypothetical protein
MVIGNLPPCLDDKLDPKSGCYCLSDTFPSAEGKKMMKFGRGINLKTRIHNYHTCFPEGLYIYGVMITHSRDSMVRCENSMLDWLRDRDLGHFNPHFGGRKKNSVETFDCENITMKQCFKYCLALSEETDKAKIEKNKIPTHKRKISGIHPGDITRVIYWMVDDKSITTKKGELYLESYPQMFPKSKQNPALYDVKTWQHYNKENGEQGKTLFKKPV